jgi:hypothetical protein
MQKRLQQRRDEHVSLPAEMSPIGQAAKLLVAMMGWSKVPPSVPSETSPPASPIGLTEKDNPAATIKSDRPYKQLSEEEKAEELTGVKRLQDQRTPQGSPTAGAKAASLEESTKTTTSTPIIQVSEEDHRRSAEATLRALNLAARDASTQLQSNPKPPERPYQPLSAEGKDRVLSDFKSIRPHRSSPAAIPSQTTNPSPDSDTPSPSAVGGDPPEKLSKEALDRAFAYVRNHLESGHGGPHYRASPLGLWTMAGNFIGIEDGLFAIHRGLSREKTTVQETGMPFEFLPISLNVLEAYATSVLATDVSISDGQEIVLSCQLDVGEALQQSLSVASDLWISLTAFSGGEPCIATSRGNVDLLQSLPATVEAKEMRVGFCYKPQQPDFIFLTSLVGCVIRMIYPGKMLAIKVPYLLQHPAKEWPRATLRFPVTNELRLKARSVIEFLLNDPASLAC